MKKKIIFPIFVSLFFVMAIIFAICWHGTNNELIDANVEALTQSEYHSLNCVPDKKSICVNGDDITVEIGYYFLQH